jgi:signal transduction histidine kinase/predicted negative regulator of RcsB-dependent stress response
MKKLLLIFTALLAIFVLSAQPKVDSLLRVCENISEKQKAPIYLELSFNTRRDSAKSNSYSRTAYQLAEKYHLLSDQAKAMYYLGETSYYSRDYAVAIPYYEKAIPLYEQARDTFNITNCFNSIGLCYHYMFQGEKAISQFIDGLKLNEHNKEYTAELISNIAMAHSRMNNNRDAIENYRKALLINISIKDSASIAVNYNGLGDVFTNMNRPDSAIVNFNKALHIFIQTKRNDRQAIALANLATSYTNYPDSLNKAISYLNRAWIIFRELGWNHFEPEIRQGLGDVLFKQGKYAEALEAYSKSLELTKEFNRGFALMKSSYQKLSAACEKSGDYKTALKYHILFAHYADSLDQKDKYEQLVNLEKQYDTEKKENEIIRLQAKQDLTDIELRTNKQLKLLGFLTASLLLILVSFMFIKYLDKIKSNHLLEEKNRQIEKSEQELRILNASKNKFFSIIAHDLKNPLHNVMGYSYLLSKDYDRFTEVERRKFAVDIYQSTNNIFRLLQNLLEWSGSQTGRLKFSPADVEFQQILNNSLSVLRALAEQKNILIKTEPCTDLKVFADPLMIETVLRNLINNAIKFTPEGGSVEITATKNDGRVFVSVIDSGIGVSDEDVQNLFRIDSKVKRKGTNNEDGSGLGLILCKEFVEKNNGSIWAESTPGQGSSFIFTIPSKAIASMQ